MSLRMISSMKKTMKKSTTRKKSIKIVDNNSTHRDSIGDTLKSQDKPSLPLINQSLPRKKPKSLFVGEMMSFDSSSSSSSSSPPPPSLSSSPSPPPPEARKSLFVGEMPFDSFPSSPPPSPSSSPSPPPPEEQPLLLPEYEIRPTPLPPPPIQNAIPLYFILPIIIIAWCSPTFSFHETSTAMASSFLLLSSSSLTMVSEMTKMSTTIFTVASEKKAATVEIEEEEETLLKPSDKTLLNNLNNKKANQKGTQKKVNQNQKEKQKKVPQKQKTNQQQQQQQQQNRHENEHSNKIKHKETYRYYSPRIEQARQLHLSSPNDALAALNRAESLYEHDLVHHDGGSAQSESLEMFHLAIDLITKKRDNYRKNKDGVVASSRFVNYHGAILDNDDDDDDGKLNCEQLHPNARKSLDGLLAHAHSTIAKQYYTANMFANSVKHHDYALNIDPYCLHTLDQRASSLIILGRFEKAGADYGRILGLINENIDDDADSGMNESLHADVLIGALSGMISVVRASPQSLEGGWEKIHRAADKLRLQMERLFKDAEDGIAGRSDKDEIGMEFQRAKYHIVGALKKIHLALFAYHDTKVATAITAKTEVTDNNSTKNGGIDEDQQLRQQQNKNDNDNGSDNDRQFHVRQAWKHLSSSTQYKMAALPSYDKARETEKLDILKQIFHQGFWSQLPTPSVERNNDDTSIVFVVGFVRSGSTLLERILDAHPSIAGTGEDSVFNGRLGIVRDDIVKASATREVDAVQKVVDQRSSEIVRITKERWREIQEAHFDTDLDTNDNSTADDSSDDNDTTKDNPQYFVDKMLSNYLNIGFIHLLFPDALILHVAREPMDTLFSAFKHEFPPGPFDHTSEFKSLAHMYLGYR